MTRALWFFVKVAVVAAIAVWLVENPGNVVIDWQGYVIETSVGVVVLAVVALVVLATLAYRLWRALRHAPGALGARRRASRRERGYKALTSGMVAIAAGDAAAAQRYAREAQNLLHDPPLTMLLAAQAAQLSGDEEAARRYFMAMLDRPETAFLGIRGLLTQALKSGNRAEALQYARRARQIQPKSHWVLTTLFDLEARSGDWAQAEATLLDAMKQGAIPQDVGRHHWAALLIERSFDAELDGRMSDALAYAAKAHDLVPSFAPAAVRQARLLARSGRPRPAAKVIERTWKVAPHPDLAEAYRDIAPDADPLAQVKRFERLLSFHPDHPESHIALARAAMAARLWGEARNHLTKALARDPDRRVYTLFAELEQAENGNEAAAREWLIKAAEAPQAPAWICAQCGAVAPAWRGLCGHCGAFDSLGWQPLAGTTHLPAVITPDQAANAGAPPEARAASA